MADHAVDHGGVDHRLAALGQSFVILAEFSILSKPGEGALHDPPPRQDLKSRLFRFLHDLHRQVPGLLRSFDEVTGVASIRPQQRQPGKSVLHAFQQGCRSVSILNTRGSDQQAQEMILGIDEEVSLSSLYSFAGIITDRRLFRPPFLTTAVSVVLTDWLSITPADGETSRPSR
jgi:hypothetical protein